MGILTGHPCIPSTRQFHYAPARTTTTGEPLGYQGASFKASSQIESLLRDGGLWPGETAGETAGGALPPTCRLVLAGFSKGGVVLNQVREHTHTLDDGVTDLLGDLARMHQQHDRQAGDEAHVGPMEGPPCRCPRARHDWNEDPLAKWRARVIFCMPNRTRGLP
jgi:hypothetical protein